MALRHRYPGTAEGLTPKEELSVPARLRPPVTVEFRRGADMMKVVAEMSNHQMILLDAAVGSGKSTIFPRVFAKETGDLVFHVVPNPLLAEELFDYAVKMQQQGSFESGPVELMSNSDQAIPRNGVLYMSSAALVALVMQRGSLSKYGSVVVFLDEAHESDAYTHLVRTLAINMGASRLIQSSATMSPSGSRSRETPGVLSEHRYPVRMTPDKWDVYDKQLPWGYAANINNSLIFLDSNTQAKRLVELYSKFGFLAYRLESGMSGAKFSEAMMALRDKRGPLVVLIADYSFRSGFTFDVGLVIDTCEVAFADPTPGAVRRMNRKAYESEAVQAAGRAGRVTKSSVEYWRPDVELDRKICDLEGVEKEAAAYLSRCLGYAPVGSLHGTVMSKANLPSRVPVPGVLNTPYPLSYYVVDSKGAVRRDCEWVENESARKYPEGSGASRRVEANEAKPLSALGGVRSAVEVSEPGSVGEVGSTSGQADLMSGEDAAVYTKLMAGGDTQELILGKYYRVSGVEPGASPVPSFPEGVMSVRRMLSSYGGDMLVAGLSKTDRKAALSMVVTRYNLLVIEAAAISSFLQGVASEQAGELAGREREVVSHAYEELNMCTTEARELLSCLAMLSYRHYVAEEIPPMQHLVGCRFTERMAYFRKICAKRSAGRDSYASALEGAVKSMTYNRYVEAGRENIPKHLGFDRPDDTGTRELGSRRSRGSTTIYNSIHVKRKPGLYLMRVS